MHPWPSKQEACWVYIQPKPGGRARERTECSRKQAINLSHSAPIRSISQPNKKKHIFSPQIDPPQSTQYNMARGHDQPNPALIIEGARRPQPSKRVQGDDYPVSALKELQKRDKGTYFGMHSSSWNCWPLEGIPKTPLAKKTSRNISNEFPDTNENGKTYSREPVGEAVRDDGTLKDAHEIEWVHSPTNPTSIEPPKKSRGLSELLDMYVSDRHDLPSVKVSCVLQIWCRNSPAAQQKTQIHGVEDHESEDEITVPQKRKNVRESMCFFGQMSTYPLFSKKKTDASPKRRKSLPVKTKETQPTLMKLVVLKTIRSQSQNPSRRMRTMD